MMTPIIRQAMPQDKGIVIDILRQSETWMKAIGQVISEGDKVSSLRIHKEVASGEFFIAECNGEAAGTVRLLLEDHIGWPDIPRETSAFMKWIAVRREFSGGEISAALLEWSVQFTKSVERRFLRLCCDESRPKLGMIFGGFGFWYHSKMWLGTRCVSRYEYDLTYPWSCC